MKYQADDTYFTDTSAGTPLLGRGGCFTHVERCASMCTTAPISSLPKLLVLIPGAAIRKPTHMEHGQNEEAGLQTLARP